MKSSKLLFLSACLGVSTAAGIWLVRHRTSSVSPDVVARYGFADGQDVVRFRQVDGLVTGRLSESDFTFLERAFDSGVRNQILSAWTPLSRLKDAAQQERAIGLLRKATSVPHFEIAVETVLNNFSINNMPLVVKAQADADPLIARVARRVVLASKGKKA